ncbi:hypothetical protein [Chryseobacterium sp. MYb328]|uniref:hypothetical protein n=1 Tax=Chryseobacterium sp. MYb328 TaxID=2745231 RepID=UPI0030A07BC3
MKEKGDKDKACCSTYYNVVVKKIVTIKTDHRSHGHSKNLNNQRSNCVGSFSHVLKCDDYNWRYCCHFHVVVSIAKYKPNYGNNKIDNKMRRFR